MAEAPKPSEGYSKEAKRFLDLAEKSRPLLPTVRAQVALDTLFEVEANIVPLQEILSYLHENIVSGDEVRAGFMSEQGGTLELILLTEAAAYALEAMRLEKEGHTAAAFDRCVDATAASSLLFGLLAGRGDADALRVLHDRTRVAQSIGGSKGGSAPKRRSWAEALAVEVRRRWPKLSKEPVWVEMVTEKEFEIDVGGIDGESYTVTVKDESLIAHRLGDGKEASLAKASFLKRYL